MRVNPTRLFDSPLERYAKFGNNRPSAEVAEKLHDALIKRGIGKPSALIMASDLCLDAFVDCSINNSFNGTDWLGKANDFLKTAISDGERKIHSGRLNRGELSSHVDAYAIAQFRLAEIKYWTKAANQEPLTSNYKAIRRAGRKVLPMVVLCPEVESRLCEAVPVLLGERAQTYGLSKSRWFGRQALTREDRSRYRKRNWDTGISTSAGAARFIYPDLRIQVKTKGTDAKIEREYHPDWVSGLAAAENGFSNAAGVVLGCCLEEGDDIPLTEAQILSLKPAGTAQLNAITERLSDRFEELALVA